MSQPTTRISRRSMLKGAAASGIGLVVGGSLLASPGGDMTIESVALQAAKDAWFAQRVWGLSGNKVLMTGNASSRPATSLARRIYLPRSAEEIVSVVKSLPATTPIACVCGGHESSNAAVFASNDAVVLDLKHLKAIDFRQDGENTLVTAEELVKLDAKQIVVG